MKGEDVVIKVFWWNSNLYLTSFKQFAFSKVGSALWDFLQRSHKIVFVINFLVQIEWSIGKYFSLSSKVVHMNSENKYSPLFKNQWKFIDIFKFATKNLGLVFDSNILYVCIAYNSLGCRNKFCLYLANIKLDLN